METKMTASNLINALMQIVFEDDSIHTQRGNIITIKMKFTESRHKRLVNIVKQWNRIENVVKIDCQYTTDVINIKMPFVEGCIISN